jgi:NADPH2:quinone reductase
MKAIQITAFGGPESMHLVDLAEPVPGPGQELI